MLCPVLFQYLEQGDPDAAVQAFSAVIEKHPDLAGAHNGLAVAYYMSDRYEDALVELDRALDLPARLDWQQAIRKLPADDPAVPMIEDRISEITEEP